MPGSRNSRHSEVYDVLMVSQCVDTTPRLEGSRLTLLSAPMIALSTTSGDQTSPAP